MTFRWIQLVILILGFTIPFASQSPNEQDADHQNSAVNATTTQQKSESEMYKSAFAPQKTRLEAQRELAQQTSSDSVSWSSTTEIVWAWVVVAIVVALAVLSWRSGRRHSAVSESPVGEVRRAA